MQFGRFDTAHIYDNTSSKILDTAITVEMVRQKFEEGISPRRAAKALGCSHEKIYSVARRYHLKWERKPQVSSAKIEARLLSGKSVVSVAADLRVSKSRVYRIKRAMRDNGVLKFPDEIKRERTSKIKGCILEGLNNCQIAKQLKLSRTTVMKTRQALIANSQL